MVDIDVEVLSLLQRIEEPRVGVLGNAEYITWLVAQGFVAGVGVIISGKGAGNEVVMVAKTLSVALGFLKEGGRFLRVVFVK